MATNQGFKSFLPGGNLDASYLYHWLKSEKEYLQSLGNGATFKELSKRTAEQIQIPLPSLSDQQRIAAILDRADTLRAKGLSTVGHLNALARSIFINLFGDPMANGLSLPTVEIGDVAEVMTGNSPSRSNPANFGTAIEWIKSGNLGDDIATTAEEWLSESAGLKARIAPPGSILVTCIAGSLTSIGKASMVDRSVAFNQQINAILPSADVDARFLLEQLKVSPELVRSKSTGGMKGLVSKTQFKKIRVLNPPIRFQRMFAERSAAIVALRKQTHSTIASLEEFVVSLRARAFRGEL